MSWEDQGRQYHQEFGSGTGPGRDGGVLRTLDAGDLASVVAAGAAVSVAQGIRGAFAAYLAAGGVRELSEAVRVWALGSRLDEGQFRSVVLGSGVPEPSALAFQKVGRLVAEGRDAGDLQAASVQLALGIEGLGSEWRYRLNGLRDEAVYARESGLLVSQRAAGGAVFKAGSAVGVGGTLVVGAGSNLATYGAVAAGALRLAGPWGLAAGALLGLGVTGWLYWRAHEDEKLPSTVENRPPSDARDKQGAKAPGKPGAAEGFEDPKGGEQWVREPRGERSGWLDMDGTVWVPTGPRPGRAHGGAHWDVQSPDGTYRNVRPEKNSKQ